MAVTRKGKKKSPEVPVFRARLIADIHFNEWNDYASLLTNGLNSRLAAQVKAVEGLLYSTGDTGERPKNLIIAGDIVHKHGTMSPAVQWAVKQLFDMATKSFDRVIVIPGNHDYELKDSGGWLHALVGMDNSGDVVQVIDSAQTLVFEDSTVGYRVGFVPWMRDKTKFREGVETVAKDGSHLLISHAAIAGFKTDNGWVYEGGMSKSVLMPEEFDAVFLGDFHTRQLQKNIYYIGAPYQMNWNDSGDDARGCLDVTVDSDFNVAVTSIESVHPKFVKVDNIDVAIEERKKGNFVKLTGVTASKKLSKKMLDGISIEMAPPVVAKQRLDVSPDSSIIDVLDAYLETVDQDDSDLAKEMIRDVCCEIVGKVDTGDLTNSDSSASLIVHSIEAENFLSYTTLNVDLKDKGVVLIDGVNLDDSHSQSNGAGKSTIVEAVFFALFGDTLRKCSIGEVVKQDSKGGMFVRLTAQLRDGRIALITRGRKRKDVPEGLSVVVGSQNLTTSGDIQKHLNSLTGITPALFKQVVVFGQEINSVFASSTDAERKSLLENLCSGGQFEPVYAQAKTAVDECEVAIRDVEHSISGITREIDKQKETLEEERGREAGYFARCGQEATSVEHSIVSEKESLKTLSSDKTDADAKIREVESKLSAYDGEHDEEELRKNRDNLRDEISAASHEVKIAESRSRSIEVSLENVDAEIGTVCNICQQTVTEQARESVVQSLRSEQAECLSSETKFREEIATLEAELKTVEDRLSVIRKNRDEKREHEREHDRLVRDRDNVTNNISYANRAIKQLEEKLKTLKDVKLNPHSEAVEKYEADLAGREKQLKKKQVSLEQLENWQPYFKECARLFGNQGLKTFLFDSLAPKITTLANDALKTLSSGTLSVEMSTERTKAGSEKISLVVNNSLGAASYRGNSGGQKKKIDLALCWAVSQLVEGHINIFVIDEAFDGLDDTSCEKVSEMLSKRVRDRGTIFVITHRSEFRDQFENVWTVTKKNGESTLVVGE